MSYHKISSSFKAAKLIVQIITKLWYLTGASAALLLGACQISGWLDNSKHKSRGFETSQELMIRCLIRYWKRALDITSRHQSEGMLLDLVFCTLYSKGSILWVQSSCSRIQCNSLMRRPQLSPKLSWCLRNYNSMPYWSSCFSFCSVSSGKGSSLMVDHGDDLQVSSWKEDKITIMQSAVMT